MEDSGTCPGRRMRARSSISLVSVGDSLGSAFAAAAAPLRLRFPVEGEKRAVLLYPQGTVGRAGGRGASGGSCSDSCCIPEQVGGSSGFGIGGTGTVEVQPETSPQNPPTPKISFLLEFHPRYFGNIEKK